MGTHDKDDDLAKQKQVPDTDFSAEQNYEASMIKGSTSKKAAVAGDKAEASAEGFADSLLQPIMMDPTFSIHHAEWFANAGRVYDRNRHNKKAVVYKDFQAQEEGYRRDSQNVQDAQNQYDTLLPLGNMAVRSVARFKAIEGALPVQGADQLKAHKKGLIKSGGTADLQKSTGAVSQAADRLSAARLHLMAWVKDYRVMLTEQVIAKLQRRLLEKKEEEAAVEAKIAMVKTAITAVTGLASGVKTVATNLKVDNLPTRAEEHPNVIEDPNGFGKVESVAGAIGEVLSPGEMIGDILYADKLADIQAEIDSLTATASQWEGIKGEVHIEAITGHFEAAKTEYTGAAKAYAEAISNRRSQYAQIGTNADNAEHHGHAKKDQDGASQAMLYMEAARETANILSVVKPAAEAAKKATWKAYNGMRHRFDWIGFDDWDQPHSFDDPNQDQDYLSVQKASYKCSSFQEGTEIEAEAFAGEEQAAATAMANEINVKGRF